jgi:hypothetical protein
MAEKRNAYKILIGQPGGKVPRKRRRWEDSIKVYLKGVVCESVNCIHLAHDSDQ